MTNEDIYIIHNYSSYTVPEIAKAMGKTADYVYKRSQYLRKRAQETGDVEVAEKLEPLYRHTRPKRPGIYDDVPHHMRQSDRDQSIHHAYLHNED